MDLDHACEEALKRLYENPDGLPFDDLGIDGAEFLYLIDNQFIEEPGGQIVENPFVRFAVHEGNVLITPRGRAYVDAAKNNAAALEKEEQARKDQIAELRRIADLTEEKSEIAANNAKAAEESAQFSKRMMIITSVIAALTLLSEIVFGIRQG